MFKTMILLALVPIIPLFSDSPFSETTRSLAISAHTQRQTNENWLFSPFSAAACLSMVYTGAASHTAHQIAEALQIYLPKDEFCASFRDLIPNLIHRSESASDYQLQIAQGMWIQNNFHFLESFQSQISHYFDADIATIDFSPDSISKINSWVLEKTDQKIQNLLSPSDIDASTKLVLANALSFKGCWVQPFSDEILSPFYIEPNVVKSVETLLSASRFPYYEDEECQAILFPLVHERTSAMEPACLVILSKDHSQLALSSDKLDHILSSLEMRTVNVQIPSFKMEQRADLRSLLEQLGMIDAFTPFADFSLIDGQNDLYVSLVMQKCYFSFEKNGVDAAAATAAVLNLTCGKPAAHLLADFHADHPFEFLLLDIKSQTCLMMGHVSDPSR